MMRGARVYSSLLLLVGATIALASLNAHAQPGPPPPYAGGTLDLSWDQCAPVVHSKASVAGPMTLYASVTGHSLPHQAYQVWLLVGDRDTRALPDAWRFDDVGCNAGRATITSDPVAALSKACPPFIPVAVQRLQITKFQFSPPDLGYQTTLGNAVLAVAYPNGGAGSPNFDPAQRYYLGKFEFDHTFSSNGPTPVGGATCGGFERGMCLVGIPGKLTWLDLNNNEYSFQYNGSAYAMVNIVDPYYCLGGIGPTPANSATWGSIKAQYKR